MLVVSHTTHDIVDSYFCHRFLHQCDQGAEAVHNRINLICLVSCLFAPRDAEKWLEVALIDEIGTGSIQ